MRKVGINIIKHPISTLKKHPLLPSQVHPQDYFLFGKNCPKIVLHKKLMLQQTKALINDCLG
jgi:hypothetical protein